MCGGFGSLLIHGQVVPTLTLAPCQDVIIAGKSEGQMPLFLEVLLNRSWRVISA